MSNASWVTPVSFENWSKLREDLRWAVASLTRTQKVHTGDTIVVYISGTNALCGVYKLIGEWTKTSEPYWPDETKSRTLKYPFQIRVQRIREGVARIGPLLSQLSFIANKKVWSAYFHSVPGNFGRPITDADLQVILNAMLANPLPEKLDSLITARVSTARAYKEQPRKGKESRSTVIPDLPLGNLQSLFERVLGLDRLARADESMERSVEYRFEDATYGIFRIMQLPVTQFGYKASGQEVPDGVIEAGDYLVLYDCKASQERVRLTARVRRDIESYVRKRRTELRNGKFVQLTFLLIASDFDGSDVEIARDMRMELRRDLRVDVQVVLLTAKALMRMLEHWIADKKGVNEKCEIFGLLEGLVAPNDVDAIWRRIK